jgi:hypothetical protein
VALANRGVDDVEAADLRVVRHRVRALAVIGHVGRELIRTVDSDANILAARGEQLTKAVDRLHVKLVRHQRQTAASAGAKEKRQVTLLRLATGEAVARTETIGTLVGQELEREAEHRHRIAQIARRLKRQRSGRIVKRALRAFLVHCRTRAIAHTVLADERRRTRNNANIGALCRTATHATIQIRQSNCFCVNGKFVLRNKRKKKKKKKNHCFKRTFAFVRGKTACELLQLRSC